MKKSYDLKPIVSPIPRERNSLQSYAYNKQKRARTPTKRQTQKDGLRTSQLHKKKKKKNRNKGKQAGVNWGTIAKRKTPKQQITKAKHD